MSFVGSPIHHFAVMAAPELIEEARSFYTEVLGFSVGFRPAFSVPGYWLYAGDQPVIHLTAYSGREPGSTGCLHHIALRCEDMADLIRRLEEKGVAYRRNDIDDDAVRVEQITVKDPLGVLIEFVHFNSN